MVIEKPISGIIAACLTPFDAAMHVDFAALEREIEFIVGHADAISIGAVEAAEYTVLAAEERRELLRRGTAMVAGRIPVILGASSPSLSAAIELTAFAAEVGADFAQVLMPLRPWGGQPSPAELVDYFTAIAEASPLPLVAYHNPGPGSDPSIETLIKLSELPNVAYFKESSRDVTKITRLIEEIVRTGNAGYFTTMQPLLTTLLMGGTGATMPAPASRIGAEVVRAYRVGDIERARAVQRIFSLFPGTWAQDGLAPVMKAAMRYFGMDIGVPARPYRPLTDRDTARLERFFRLLGLTDIQHIPASLDIAAAADSLRAAS